MKKWMVALLSMTLVLGITACSKEKETGGDTTGTTPTEQKSGNNEKTNAEAPKEDALPTVDELIQKSAEASQKMKSFALDTDIKQNMVFGDGENKQEQDVSIVMNVETTLDPLEMVQEMTMDIPGEGKQDIKQYITQNGVYSSVDGQWFQLPEENVKEIMANMEMTKEGPEKQLEQFKTITKDTKIAEEGDSYILTADVSGDSLKELAKSYMSQAGGSNDQTAAMLEQMDIKSMKIMYGVKKDTYLPTKSDVDMVLSTKQDGQSLTIDMKMKSEYTKHNEIDKIEVPQEALDSAKASGNAK
ncbi:DUF6612 family protein [Paenibacillus dakarensis]|uniref:DUF6612 family protein n=1 Tax=Paenibacillus dakarensis TaxID=1527293 RepID=UPI0006D57F91|nr:DUF6612 family protein [Paenibacillus dakarensis]